MLLNVTHQAFAAASPYASLIFDIQQRATVYNEAYADVFDAAFELDSHDIRFMHFVSSLDSYIVILVFTLFSD